MNAIDGILFTSGAKPSACTLTIASAHDLRALLSEGRPRAYVIRDTDLAMIARLAERIHPGADRGRQTEGVELPRVFENARTPVALVRSRYVRAGHLLNGARDLVEQSHLPRGPMLFVIGARSGDRAEEDAWAPGDGKQRERVSQSVFERLRSKIETLVAATPEDIIERRIVGSSPAVVKLRQEIRRALRRLESPPVPGEGYRPLLLLGETGTGKTSLAQTVHLASSRAGAAFVNVSCPALTPLLYRAEMHGTREKLAGMDGDKWTGYLEQAHRGILMLEEIGDAPREIQAQLLDDIGKQIVRPVGANEAKHVDFWTIAATERDLRTLVARNEFRGALYHRLEGMTIHVPPLRELGEDRDLLAQTFWQREVERHRAEGEKGVAKEVPSALLATFREYAWPGNVRQLAFYVEDLVDLAFDDPCADLVAAFQARTAEESWGLDAAGRPSQLAKLAVFDQVARALDGLREAVLPVLVEDGVDESTRRRVMAAVRGEVAALEALSLTRSVREADQLRGRVRDAHRAVDAAGGASRRAIEQQFKEAGALLREHLEEAASAMHAAYLKAIRQVGRTDGVAYDRLSDEMKASNRQQVFGLIQMLRERGYQLRPLRATAGEVASLPTELVKEMAEREHERWRTEREALGWRYATERSTAARTNPHLLTWRNARLSGDARDISIASVRAIPVALQWVGIGLHPVERAANERTRP